MNQPVSPVLLASKQRSHHLYLFSQANTSNQASTIDALKHQSSEVLLSIPGVLSSQVFKRKDYDISQGISKNCDYDFLTLVELVVDGAEQALPIMERIAALYQNPQLHSQFALWLYYPVSEKSGRSPDFMPFMSIAFAAPIAGLEKEFREWYSTQHIRHALNIPTYVSAQRFEACEMQYRGATLPYPSAAVYEQEGGIEDIIEGMKSFDNSKLTPSKNAAMDLEQFAEWVFYPLSEKNTTAQTSV